MTNNMSAFIVETDWRSVKVYANTLQQALERVPGALTARLLGPTANTALDGASQALQQQNLGLT